MVNLDALQRYTLDHQQQLLDEAARWRLIYGRSTALARKETPSPSVQARFARLLRRTADRLEPIPPQPRLGVLRAVAHREISVEQALTLLEASGHRSLVR